MLRAAARSQRSPSRPRLQQNKSDSSLALKIIHGQLPVEQPSPYQPYSWRAVLLPEVDYRYQLLKMQGLTDSRLPQSRRFISRLSLISNSPQKKSKLSDRRSTRLTRLEESGSLRGPRDSCGTFAE